MKEYKLTADVQVKVWQRCEYTVEAESKEECLKKLIEIVKSKKP